MVSQEIDERAPRAATSPTAVPRREAGDTVFELRSAPDSSSLTVILTVGAPPAETWAGKTRSGGISPHDLDRILLHQRPVDLVAQARPCRRVHAALVVELYILDQSVLVRPCAREKFIEFAVWHSHHHV